MNREPSFSFSDSIIGVKIKKPPGKGILGILLGDPKALASKEFNEDHNYIFGGQLLDDGENCAGMLTKKRIYKRKVEIISKYNHFL